MYYALAFVVGFICATALALLMDVTSHIEQPTLRTTSQMLNIAELVTDPDFAQPYVIARSSGVFALGGFISTTVSIPAVGPIVLASERDLDQVPEGDRVTGAMTFYCTQELFATRAGNAPGLSDVIFWRGENYRLAKVFPYLDYGWNKAVGVRMSGD